jgi:7SK snRNA methylphosphate capping enzyme
VVKWIHLNWGDEGLLRFFTKVYRTLKPGGLFILEPQPWKSYRNNRGVSEVRPSTVFYVDSKILRITSDR